MEYMGPGTHIKEKIDKKVKPHGKVDAASMIHDIEYLHPGIREGEADDNALKNAGSYLNPLKVVMATGFAAKDLFGGYNSETDYAKYKLLRQEVEDNMSDVLSEYSVEFIDDPYDVDTTAGDY